MNKFLHILLITIISGAAATAYASQSSVGELEIIDQQGQRQTALLLNTAISGEVHGLVATLVIEQTFNNQTDQWVNGRYVFPLSETAAVDGLQIQIGERIINAQVQAKQDAKRTFEQAKKAGKKAGLLEQHRANLFSMSVANIAPGETLVARITLVDQVVYREQTFSLTIPTTLTPRYIAGAPIKLSRAQRADIEGALSKSTPMHIDPASGWASNTTQVPDAAQITPPQSYPLASATDQRFSLDLQLNAGLDLPIIESHTHGIVSQEFAPAQYQVSLAEESSLMNKDLRLSWQTQAGSSPSAAFFEQPFAGHHYAMVMLTPPQLNTRLALPRDVTFVIDTSGSMAGASMSQAKQALLESLAYLSSNDRFNIVEFDSDFHTLFRHNQFASSDNLQRARSMVLGLNADGGTEMMGALQFALDQPSSDAALKQIIFITDGAVGNESELFKLISTRLGDARLFTVGIGSAPNAFLMSKAAKFGRGSYTYIRNTQQVQREMAALFDKISTPVMRDIQLSWPAEVEQFPARIPDLYAGEPISVLVRSKQPLSEVVARGQLLDTPWQQKIALRAKQAATNLDTVWARNKIAELMDQLALGQLAKATAKQQITELGIRHSIVSKFTALVAVEKTPSKPSTVKATHKNVPNLMPHGSRMPIPQTASWASVLQLSGLLTLLIAIAFSARRNRGERNKPSVVGV